MRIIRGTLLLLLGTVLLAGLGTPMAVAAADPLAAHDLLALPLAPGVLAWLGAYGLPAASGVAALALVVVSARLASTRRQNRDLCERVRALDSTQTELQEQNARLQREIGRRTEAEAKLSRRANFDELTGLPNRNLALDRLDQAIKWAKRDGSSVLTLFLDLDRFKEVNDSLGHAAGDSLLREAAERLRSRVRESDTVSRLGGDEFLVICPDMPADSDWTQLAGQMLVALSVPFYLGDHEIFIGASIGVAVYPGGGHDSQRLLKNVDTAMYAAKEKGRNRWRLYDPSMEAVTAAGKRLENNLRQALRRGEFHLVFQPIVELSSGRTFAVEALLRWHNPELGNVPPARFIPVAEETGLIHEIGDWVIGEACRVVARLQPALDLRVAVNVSSRQFSRPGRLLDSVLYALRDSGLTPGQLELEIRESVLIDEWPETSKLIDQLDRIGVRLSVDDFGTGYSALNYLQRLPFDVLKIDHSFTAQLPGDGPSSSLVRAIIAMAHAFGIEVVAEGIEDRGHAGFLLIQHCEYGQGRLYSPPLTAAELREHLSGADAIPA